MCNLTTVRARIAFGILVALMLLPLAPSSAGPSTGTFDHSWYQSYTSPSTSTIVDGVLETRQSNPNVHDYANSFYDTAQKGSFPWKGQPTTPPMLENTISVTLQLLDRTLQEGSRYQLFIGLYYYLPNGPVQGCNNTLDKQGCHTHQWVDTEIRLAENINGADSNPGTESTWDPGDSFGYARVIGQLQPGQADNASGLDTEARYQSAALNWNIDAAIPHELLGVEVGTSGYSVQSLNVDWYTAQLMNSTLPRQPSDPSLTLPTSFSGPSTAQPVCLLCQASDYSQGHIWLVIIGILAGFTIPVSFNLLRRRVRSRAG